MTQAMVQVVKTGLLSGIRGQSKYRSFPDDDLQQIRSAIEEVSTDIFQENTKGAEIKRFDALVADNLVGYEHEHDHDNGRNPVCKLWERDGFDYSVDMYNPEDRIAIEIE